MIKKTFLIFLLGLLSFCNNAQVDAIMSVKRFKSPSSAYIESYLKIFSSSINFGKNDFGGVYYQIEVTQLLRLDSNIVDYKKYILKSGDTSSNNVLDHLIDLQRFYVLNDKDYTLEIEIKDLLDLEAHIYKLEKDFTIHFSDNEILFSDIELIDSYAKATDLTRIAKSGYDIIPLVDDFIANDFLKIAYYTELYNTKNVLDSGEKYLLVQYIENYDNKKQFGQYFRMKKYSSTSTQPILNLWDIDDLPTGNYSIVVQARNKDNKVIGEQKLRFQRLNLKNNIQLSDLNQQDYIGSFAANIPLDSLDEQIKRMFPIASELEQSTIRNQLSTLNEKMKREFVFKFWENQNRNNPEKEWRDYSRKINYAQHQYGSRRLKGYNTDRGRIYLKYGLPNSLNDYPSSSNLYPYQVWHYYRAGKFNNKTCIFYSPNMIGNQYELLHSDIPGEIIDINWKRTLKRKSGGVPTQDLQHRSWDQY